VNRKSSFALKLIFSLLAAGSSSAIFATSTLPSCTTASLASYISTTAFPPTTGGCAIGILDYYNFSYIMGTGPASSALEVTPNSSGLDGGFNFSLANGNPITAAPGQTVTFEIDYQIVIDPAPIVTGGDLKLDPPSGDVTITEYFCNDISYVPTGFCLGGSTPDTLQVTTANPTASITFPDPATKSQQVGIVFTLVGGANGASFDGLDANSIVTVAPEPASAGFLAGLLVLVGGYKLRKRRNGST
jgi:hypothetical protein